MVTVLAVPLLYVAGNHDVSFRAQPPGGCEDIDGRVVRIGGLRIAGLVGCMRYNAGREEYQSTERTPQQGKRATPSATARSAPPWA